MLIGMAKPMPRFRPRIKVLMPMTRPSMSHSGPPELPGIDRRVGLDVIFIGVAATAAADAAAAFCADESDRETVIEFVRRTDGDRPLPDLDRVAVAESGGGKIFSIDFDDRHVDAIIDADHHRIGELGAVLQQHRDLSASINDMLIGEDVPVLAQDDARSLALNVGFVLLRHVAEEEFKGRTLELLTLAILPVFTALRFRLRGLVLGGDDDHRRAGLIGDPLERAFEVPGEIDVAVRRRRCRASRETCGQRGRQNERKPDGQPSGHWETAAKRMFVHMYAF